MIRALLLALALAGCEGQVHVESVPIAQADPTKEADWPGIYGYRRPHYVFQRKNQFPARNPMWTPDSLTKEADWPGLNEGHSALSWGYRSGDGAALVRLPGADGRYEWMAWPALVDTVKARNPDSLTVTNATPRTLLLEQECVVTLAKPGSTQTVALEGSVTIREEASYDAEPWPQDDTMNEGHTAR